MGSLAFLRAEERPLALEVQFLARLLVRLTISLPHSMLAFIE